jgi:hypothetical protein
VLALRTKRQHKGKQGGHGTIERDQKMESHDISHKMANQNNRLAEVRRKKSLP